MKIAIIGTGNVGSALGTTFSNAGHDVVFAAQDHAKAEKLARQVGADAAATSADAVAGADVVVLAVPYGALETVAREIEPSARGKVVIDVTNPLTPDYSAVATAGGPSAAEQLADVLDRSKIVKAFNTMFASVQADPQTLGTTVDALFATDDADARAKVAELVSSVGFRPVHVGGLSAARELESLAFLNIRLQVQTGGDWRSATLLLGAPEAATGTPEPASRR
jgi:NADPH-dependent F420 reductase